MGEEKAAPKPRSWTELRRRVLDEDYLSASELQKRKRRAHQLKYALWLIPIVVVGVAPDVVERGVSWLTIVGATQSYLLGARWEQRWDEMLEAKGEPLR